MARVKKTVKLALGSKARSYYDPVSKITINLGQVVIKPKKKSHHLNEAIKGGHVIVTTDAEYDKYIKAQEKLAKKALKNAGKKEDPILKDELYEKSREEILAAFKDFQDEDLEKAQAIEDDVDMLRFLRKTEEEYTD